MKLLQLKGSYGALRAIELSFDAGAQLIKTREESQTADFCALLSALLYGKAQGDDAKLAATLACSFAGRAIRLVRQESVGDAAHFAAQWITAQGEEASELEAQGVGARITGLSATDFARFCLLAPPQGELLARIAALVSTGEEGLSAFASLEALQTRQQARCGAEITRLRLIQKDAMGRIEQIQSLEEEARDSAQRALALEAGLPAAREKDEKERKLQNTALQQEWQQAGAALDRCSARIRTLVDLTPPKPLSEHELSQIEAKAPGRKRKLLTFAVLGVVLAGIGLVPQLLDLVRVLLAVLGLGLAASCYLSIGRLAARDQSLIAQMRAEARAAADTWAGRDAELYTLRAQELEANELYMTLTRQLDEAKAPSLLYRRQEEDIKTLRARAIECRGALAPLGDLRAHARAQQEAAAAEALLQEEYSALTLAIEVLGAETEHFRAEQYPQLKARMLLYLMRLCGRELDARSFRYAGLCGENDAARDELLAALSASDVSVSQLYFALRLAACEVFCPTGAQLPLIIGSLFDEGDERAAQASLALLQALAKTRQVVILTSDAQTSARLADLLPSQVL